MRVILAGHDNIPPISNMLNYLRHQEFEILASEKHQHILSLLKQGHIDCLLVTPTTDISFLKLVSHIRSNDIQTPIITISARSRWEDYVMASEAGADMHLPYPFPFNKLKQTMDLLLTQTANNTYH